MMKIKTKSKDIVVYVRVLLLLFAWIVVIPLSPHVIVLVIGCLSLLWILEFLSKIEGDN